MNEILNARLLEIRQVFCVVQMSLRIQIPVTDFGGMKEEVIGHAPNYTR
jgi:hypothetical protein